MLSKLIITCAMPRQYLRRRELGFRPTPISHGTRLGNFSRNKVKYYLDQKASNHFYGKDQKKTIKQLNKWMMIALNNGVSIADLFQ